MIDLTSDCLQKSAQAAVEFANVRNFLKDVTQLFVQEQNFLLEELVLTSGWHLANSCQENVDVASGTRFNEIGKERWGHIALFDHFCVKQRRRIRFSSRPERG